jgi:hypothetical protein
LPATGDYALTVYPSPYTGNTGYQLRIEITSSSTPAPAPERIRFASGATSAQVTGYLPTASSKLYVLGARAGQIMTIESYTSSGPFRFTVSEANGATLGSGNQGDGWSGTLPRTGDYNLTVQSPMDASPANYALRITIVNAAPAPTPTPVPPPLAIRINFPQGATGVTLTGYVDSYSPARYVLRALNGQRMTVDLNTLYGHHTNITVRDGQGNFLGTADGGEAWSGNLPYTGDYYLEVQAPPDNPGELFSLRVEIRW